MDGKITSYTVPEEVLNADGFYFVHYILFLLVMMVISIVFNLGREVLIASGLVGAAVFIMCDKFPNVSKWFIKNARCPSCGGVLASCSCSGRRFYTTCKVRCKECKKEFEFERRLSPSNGKFSNTFTLVE